MKISIGIVLFKGEKYLKSCLESLINQTYSSFELLLRDQSPNNEAFLFLQKNFPEIISDTRVKIFSGENLWHSGGHNFLISQMRGEAYLCASNDMIYDKNLLKEFIKALKKNPEYSIFTGKLYQWNFSSNQKTEIFDSCGLGITPFHHFFDRGQGQEDNGQFDKKKEIFGASGALFLIKKKALEEVGVSQNFSQRKGGRKEYFDELLHYKNDVDLAYRLFLQGEKCCFVPFALAWHDRQISEKTQKSQWIKESSSLGYFVIFYKNILLQKLPFFITIKTYSYIIIRFLYACLFTLGAIKKFLEILPELKKKRDFIQKNRKNRNENVFYECV